MTTSYTTCKHCGRPIFLATVSQGWGMATLWNLVYREYAETLVCDKRAGDIGARLPHEPMTARDRWPGAELVEA